MLGIRRKINNHIYKKLNKHNFTLLNTYTDPKLIQVGKFTYGNLNVITHSGENAKLIIGNYCSIADKVVFMLSGEHEYHYLSTYPLKKIFFNISESKTKGDIIIDDDVWIGYDTLILSGVKIGKGAVIGAKSIVAKDVPPYAIYAGNKIIKYRFSEKVIDKLKKIDYEKLSKEFVEKNLDIFYKELTEDNIEEIIKKIEGI